MSVESFATAVSPSRRRRERGPRLVGAEFLKLRKRRGLVLSSLGLTVVPMLVGYTVVAVQACERPGPARPGRWGGELRPVDRAAQRARGHRRDSHRRHRGHGGSPSRCVSRARDHGALATLTVRGANTGRSRAAPPVRGRWVPHRGRGLDRPRGWGADAGVPPAGLTGAWIGLAAALTFVLALGVSSVVGSTGPSVGILSAGSRF